MNRASKNLFIGADNKKCEYHLTKIFNYRQMKKLKYFIITMFLLVIIIEAQEKETPPAPPPAPYFEISEEMEKDFLKNIDTELQFRLQNIKEYDKNEYFELLSQLQFSKFEHDFFSEREKEYNELEKKVLTAEIESKSLLAELKKAEASEKSKLKMELKNSVSQLFDLKEEMRRKEIDRLTERLADLNKKLKVRTKNKDEIVTRRLQELLGEDDYLDWD
jgi:hypothetical protein